MLYNIITDDFVINDNNYKWLNKVRSIFEETGLNHVWTDHQFPNVQWVKHNVEAVLKDQYRQLWYSTVSDSSKCINYRIFKHEHQLENYLLILPQNLAQYFINYRLCNNYLPIETGRWRQLDRHNRKCTLCDSSAIGDEFHFVFECTYFGETRKKHLSKYFCRRPNTFKLDKLFNISRIGPLTKLCKFLKEILNQFKPP